MKKNNKEDKKDVMCIITAIFENKEYTSSPIKIEDNSIEAEVIRTISENGTNTLNMFKMPISDDEFVIFSRKQLDSTLFKVKVYDK